MRTEDTLLQEIIQELTQDVILQETDQEIVPIPPQRRRAAVLTITIIVIEVQVENTVHQEHIIAQEIPAVVAVMVDERIAIESVLEALVIILRKLIPDPILEISPSMDFSLYSWNRPDENELELIKEDPKEAESTPVNKNLISNLYDV